MDVLQLEVMRRKITNLLVSAAMLVSVLFPLTGGASTVYANSAAAFTAPLTEKIMEKNTAQGTLELELAGVLPLAPGYTVEHVVGGQTYAGSLSQVMIGAENVTAYPNDAGQIAKLVINGVTPADRMRVGIRRDIADITDNTTFDHAKLDIQSANGYTLLDKKGNTSFAIPAAKLVTFTTVSGQIVVMMDGAELYRTANRMYATQLSPDSSLLQIMTFRRAQGNPLYRNTLEISLAATPDRLKLVNDITLEQYLYQVVPSEMPASFGLEALKAQAVAARTYALTDYYSNRFADRGFHIDDSTLSQVFNNSTENALTTQAVNATAGLIMKSGGQLVDARFYSTSGGFGASKHEVWSDLGATTFPGTPIPYLIARSYTYDKADPSKMLELNTSDEQALNAFYKDLSYRGFDSESLYFRWKIGLTGQELQNTINANLVARYTADPAFILSRQPDGSFASQPIPPGGVGTLTDISVAKRGAGGNITELVITGTTGTYKIIKEFNIRFLIRPSKAMTGSASDILAYRAKGGSADYDPAGTLRNPSILYSAFFTFDVIRGAAGSIAGITFYGGGNGHGVGMSQYAASMLGLNGWKFDQILNSYYANMQLQTAAGQPFQVMALELGGLAPMNPGDTRQAQVAAIYNDGSRVGWTAGVRYASSNPAVATVSPSGLVTAIGYGQTVITVSYSTIAASYSLSVASSVASLEIGGLAPMKAGESLQSVVTAVYADGTRVPLNEGVTFVSSNPVVATVDETGLVTAASMGETVITASFEGRIAEYRLNVTSSLRGISIDKLKPMRAGETVQLTVTAHYSDDTFADVTASATIASSDPNIAAIDASGNVTALEKGHTTLTATYAGQTAEEKLNVQKEK
ncbi:SpoIID/LytB domain protein [Paenibacillus sp. V4I5]|nr:SpoIID/LytB domain protein [Paenibacillus sp. V4I5]